MFRLLLLLLLLCRVAAAQPLPARQYLKQFGAADGLPQPFIYALHQDPAGYLWIGTAEGLVRFDGTTFQTFTTREGLAEDFVTRLAEDPRTGHLWVGHYRGHVSVSSGNRFEPVPSSQPSFLPRRAGPQLPDTARLGQFRRRYRLALPAAARLTCLLRDAEGTYWLGTAGHGLWRLTDAHVSSFFTLFSPRTLAAAEGQVLVGTANGHLLHVQPSSAGWGTAALTTTLLPQSFAVAPTAIAAWQQGTVVGTLGDGLWHLPAAGPARRLPALPPDARVLALAPDAAGGLWVGTLADGATYLPATGPPVQYTTATGLLHNDVYAILPDRQGRVWFATHGTGLAVLDNGRFVVHRLAPGGVNISALAQDKEGRVWVGTEGDGAFCFTGGRFRRFTTGNSGLTSDYCYGLLPTAGGLVVQHRHALTLLRDTSFTPLTTTNSPVVRDLLPQAAATPTDSVVLLAARGGLVRVQVPAHLPSAAAEVVLTAAEVDGTRGSIELPELPARPHHVTWFFRVASLAPQGTWQYQYRLRGFHTDWSRPTSLPEADFPRLDAGRYVLEVRARRGSDGAWGAPATAQLHVATPFWRTGWFIGLLLLLTAALVYVFIWVRTAALRRQKLQLETTVRERTAQLRRQKAETERINADLVVARDAAEASRRAKAQFLANMSHEIRTPMNAVIGLTHLLRNTPVDAEQSEYLAAIQSSSNNLLVILNDILDSSKMEAGKLTLERTAFRLLELVESVARMFQFAAEAKGLSLHTELAPNLPTTILGDPVRLNQILINLVGNAIKFTAQGSVTLRLEAVPAGPGSPALLRFGVQDTGIGIPADKQEAIFEDFSQANASTTRQFGGTGLGLSIARSLVELHDGRLWVESREGHGSTFWFEIPCQPAEQVPAQPAAAATELTPFSPPLRVLVAEDNELNQLVARKTLEAWNVHVTLAANGRLAVQAAQEQPFDAVLLDIHMPEMDGYEAARQLRALFPDVARLPLIGLTASALPEDRMLAQEAGMNDTLSKPFDPAVLYARLAYFTGRRPAPGPLPAAATAPAAEPSPPTGRPTTQPDWTLLDELAAGNEAFVQQIVRTFLTQAPELLRQLQAAPTAAEQAATAHKLKGQAAYFGLPELVAALERVEQHAAQAPAAETAAQVHQIGQQLCHVYPYLEQRLPPAAVE